jgi:hypothetical protein
MHPEASKRFKLLATMSKADATVGMALGRRARRNEPRHISKTTLLPVHLPQGFYDLISTCSAIVVCCQADGLAYASTMGWMRVEMIQDKGIIVKV